MDIQKFLEIAEINKIFQEHDIDWAGEWIIDFSVPDYEKAYFLGAWKAWQAAKSQAAPEWVSVDDELPSEGDLLLGISTTKLAKFNVYQVVALDEFDDCEITHWMHLPQAPNEQEQSHD